MSVTTLPTESTDAPLRRALRVDGACSTVAGVALLAAVGPVSSATGMSAVVTAALAGGTVLCGVAFLALSRVVNVRPAGVSVAAGNLAFTAAGLASPPLTTVGVLSVLGAGAYTAGAAAAQYRGVRRMSVQA